MVSQNSPEWLELRKNMIGASDAAPIMGVSPYRTALQLWEEKMNLVAPQTETFAMKRGHNLEDQARLQLEQMTGIFFLPQVKFHVSIPYMMASLDAIDPENKNIAEIKCANIEDHQVALSGSIPEKYFPQLQHQLEVCELEMGYYFSFHVTGNALVKVYRDDKYIKNMLEQEKKFFECMETFTAPEMSEKDYIPQDSDMWKYSASELLQVRSQLKALEEREKHLTDTLVGLSSGRNSMGFGIVLTRYFRKGAIEYGKIPDLQGINLERFRKNPTECYKISQMKTV